MTEPVEIVRTTVVIQVIERAAPAVVELVTRGPQGQNGADGSGVNVDHPLTADQTLSGHRVVRLVSSSRVDVADSSDPADARQVLGITLNAAVADDPVTVRQAGAIDDPSFTFTPGLPIYFTALGVLTHTLPTTGFIQQVAIAASATQILVQLGPAIVLA